MSKLNQTCEIKRDSVQELLNNGVILMDKAVSVTKELIANISTLKGIYDGIPAEAQCSGLMTSITDFEALNPADKIQGFETMKQKLTYGLEKMLYDLPVADNLLANKIAESTVMTGNCIAMLDSLIATIPIGPNADWDKLITDTLFKLNEVLKSDGNELKETMESYSKILKGIEFYTAVLSKDPVNLCTGNFIYQKEDFSLVGRFPVSFGRFYNALNKRRGRLGNGWNHNFEIYIEINEKKDTAAVILEDGREDIYQKTAEGLYTPFWFCGSTLEKTVAGYQYTTQEQRKYLFNKEGRNIRQQDLNGNGLTLIYEDMVPDCSLAAPQNPWRLARVVEDMGHTITFTYNDQGYLGTVTDHSGRSLRFTYQDDNLHTVTDFAGGISTYSYGWNGKIETITGPREIAIVTNCYDRRDRTIGQKFPDGGEMRYEYLDKERTVILTEQSGNRIRYIHDGQMRHIKTVYTDETGNPISEENYEYNSKNRKKKCVNRNGNRIRYKYDSRGNVTEITNPLHYRTSYRYNDQNRLIQVKQPDGSFYNYEYDAAGNPVKATDPLGNTQEIRYDEGLPITVCQPDGSENLLAYDRRGNIRSITDAGGNVTRYEYDSLNRVIKTVSGEGHITSYAYNTRNDIIKITNAEGNSQEYEYNAAGKVTRITGFDGGVTAYAYNALGKLAEAIGPSGRRTLFSYDLMWNLAGVTDPLGNEQRFEYDRYNRLSKVIDQEGFVTTYEYDKNGNITAVTAPTGARTEIGYDAMDRICEIREADGAVTRYTYDILGNLEMIIDPQCGETKVHYNSAGQMESLTDPIGNTTAYTYSPLGRLVTITDPLGARQLYDYYPGGWLRSVTRPDGMSEHYTYDRNGNIIQVADGEGNITDLTYDCMDRVTVITDPLGNSKRFGYDAQGNITAVTDENGGTTAYTYSPSGEVIQVTDPLGGITRYGYDGAGRLTQMEQYRLWGETYANIRSISDSSYASADDNSDYPSEASIVTWEYSRRGEVTRIRTPLGEDVRYRYDGNGNLTAMIDEDGFETLYEYNLANKLSHIRYSDGRTVELSYGPLRRLKEMRDWLGITTIETDAIGRVVKVTDHEEKSVGYEWDALSRRTGIIYPDGNRVSYRYSQTGKIEEVSTGAGSTQYIYNTSGRLCERILPGDTVTRYSVDAMGRVTELTHQVKGELTDRFRYAYDTVGNITGIEKYRRGAVEDSGQFVYAYDLIGRLTEVRHGDNINKYHYDSLSNRVMSDRNGIMTVYSHNARNQLFRSQSGETVTDYVYDARGNLSKVMENGIIKAQYLFDATGCLTGAIADGNKAEYIYNGFLRCIKSIDHMATAGNLQNGVANMQEPTREMRYILDLIRPYNDLLAVESKENQRFIWGRELLMSEGDDPFCYLSDHQGTPIRLLNELQEDILAYDEFGVSVVKSNAETSFSNPFGFTGYRMGKISGLYHAQSRQYSSEIGRFVNEDPLKDRLNWYDYCYGNPVNYIDPKGAAGLSISSLTILEGISKIIDGISDAIAPVVNVVYVIKSEIENTNLSNTNEDVVFKTKFISAYKDQIVFRTNLDRGASFGSVILLRELDYKNKDQIGINTLRHEAGHYVQYQKLGFIKYVAGIFVPSASNGYVDTELGYYSQPWEIYAEVQGGVQRSFAYWPDAGEMGNNYMKILERFDSNELLAKMYLESYNRLYSAVNFDFMVLNKDG